VVHIQQPSVNYDWQFSAGMWHVSICSSAYSGYLHTFRAVQGLCTVSTLNVLTFPSGVRNQYGTDTVRQTDKWDALLNALLGVRTL